MRYLKIHRRRRPRLSGAIGALAPGRRTAAWVGQESAVVVQLPLRKHRNGGKRSDSRWWEGQVEGARCTPLATDVATSTFRRCLGSQIAIIELDSGELGEVGQPGLYERVDPSPDGRFLLVTRLATNGGTVRRQGELRRSSEIWKREDGWAYSIQTRDLSTTARWYSGTPATVLWTEHDRENNVTLLLAVDAPFENGAREFGRTREWMSDCWRTTEGNLVAVRHGRTRSLLYSRRSVEEGTARARWDGAFTLAPTETPMLREAFSGPEAVESRGEVYVCGRAGGAEGRSSYVDGVELKTGKRRRVGESGGDGTEVMIALVGRSASELLSSVEGPRVSPRLRLRHVESGSARYVTGRRAAPGMVAAADRDVLTYWRGGDAEFSALRYTPAAMRGRRNIPYLVWVYPRVFPGGQRRADGKELRRYERMDGRQHFAILHGAGGVVHEPELPVLAKGDGTGLVGDELVCSAEAVVEALVSKGGADPSRIAIGGRCLGAWAAAMLLAHTDLFRGGVLLSGFYNAAVMSYGSLAGILPGLDSALEGLREVSPVYLADRIAQPTLLLYGEREGPPVESRLQSRQMFNALAEHGRSVRLVELPEEGHGCSAAASSERVATEVLNWFERNI